MSSINDRPTIRQQSSENNSISSSEWDMANDVFVSGYDDDALGDGDVAGHRDFVRHLPILSQDGMVLGLAREEYLGSSYLEIDPNYIESDGNATTKKRIRSNSSRHRGEVVTELGPEEVRWFYKEDKRTWKPFVGHDSLKIEVMYRRYIEQNPDRRPADPPEAKGKEAEGDEIHPKSGAGECRNGEGGSASEAADCANGRVEPTQRFSASEETRESEYMGIRVEAVCVRGGIYEVDIREKECYPVYWNQQDRIPVMRGQWFIDGTWLPLEEDESDHIEMEHLAHFRGQQMRDTYEMEVATTTVDSKDAIDSLKLSRSHVDWHSVDEVYLYSDATTSKIARTVTQKLGFSKASSSGTRLHRGYVEEAAPEDTPPETTHIVFVVHGIGQKMDQGRIIRNTSMMRDAARKMEEKHFSNHTTEHVEFFPVEWRSKLSLDGDTVDSITPDKVRGLREMLNGSAMDIMYYTSPLYRDEVENFFCMGSPLAVFLALRGIRPGNNGVQGHILPTSICRRLFNIFHPTDPVAYRLEPLILKHYNSIAPVQIHWYNTTSPTRYDQIRQTLLNPSVSDSESIPSPCTSPTQARRHYGESITSLGKASIIGAASLGKGIGGILFSRFSRSGGQVGGVEDDPSYPEGGTSEVENVTAIDEGATVAEVEEEETKLEQGRAEVEPAMYQSTSAVLKNTSMELERRIDFELREGLVESRYWSAVTSHTAYWCSYDVALFLLTFMYRPQEYFEPAEDNLEM